MGLSSAEEVGRQIANALNRINDLEEDAFPNESLNSLLISPIELVKGTVIVTGTRFNYPETSFIIDHSVYGELDSSTLEIDGGYLITETGANFPLTFANNGGLGFSFDETSIAGSSILFTYTS